MIIGITGMPGGGKSFFLTKRSLDYMKKGRTVYSNFYIKGTYKIDFDDLCEYTFPPNSVLIVDEAGQWFNARNWTKLPDDIFSLFTMHRHLGLDMIIGVQNFARIDKSLREVMELIYWSKNFPILPFFILDGYYDLEKVGSMKNSDLRKIIWKSRRVKKAYDTHTMKDHYSEKNEIPLIPWEENLLEISFVQKIKNWYRNRKIKKDEE